MASVGRPISRLRWDVTEDSAAAVDRATMARTFFYLYAFGAALVLLTLALPHDPDRWAPGLIAPALLALATAILLAIRFDRLPHWFFLALPILGTLLVSVVVYSGGGDTLATYSALYFWVMLAGFSLFSLRAGLLNLGLVAISFGVVLELAPGAGQLELRWLMVLGTLTVAGLVMAGLRGRVESLVTALRLRAMKQDAIAELGRLALTGATAANLDRVASERVGEALRVERAAVLLNGPEEDNLVLEAGVGWGPEVPEWAAVTRQDPLLKRALATLDPVTVEGYDQQLAACGYEGPLRGLSSAIAVAIPGPEQPVGVIAAYSRDARSFNPTQAAFMQGVAHVLGDAAERRRTEAEATRRALEDRLTRRPNRTLFTERLEQVLAREEGRQVAIYFLDIDDFKLINDSFGHEVGDGLLKAFAARLRRGLVMTDTVARFGGDEFAVLCEGIANERQGITIAERLREALSEPFEIEGVPHRVSASIGVALATNGVKSDELIARADAAMYLAKERSRGGFELFGTELQERVQSRLRFSTALWDAAATGDDLRLVLHPIVSLPGGEDVGSEALLRWDHPELGSISPAEFIPVAEQTGAILPIGRWVIEEAFSIAARWRGEPAARGLLPIHVNVSARQLAQAGFAAEVGEAAERTGIRIRDVRFEITEHALISEALGTVTTLEKLQGMGIPIVLDDFGTGYSSLSHLKRFPIDMVKVDRLFVSNLITSPKDEAIVSAVIGMSDAFGLDVVAEGIETWEQATRLGALGCRFGQGFLFDRPSDPEELLAARRGNGYPAESMPSSRKASDLV